MNKYRVFFNKAYMDFESGYSALRAAALLANECKIRVAERHGTKWFTLATAEKGGNLAYTGKKRDYYLLPCDQYHQPTGMIDTVCLYKAEAILLKGNGAYLFDNYVAACYRADA